MHVCSVCYPSQVTCINVNILHFFSYRHSDILCVFRLSYKSLDLDGAKNEQTEAEQKEKFKVGVQVRQQRPFAANKIFFVKAPKYSTRAIVSLVVFEIWDTTMAKHFA